MCLLEQVYYLVEPLKRSLVPFSFFSPVVFCIFMIWHWHSLWTTCRDWSFAGRLLELLGEVCNNPIHKGWMSMDTVSQHSQQENPGSMQEKNVVFLMLHICGRKKGWFLATFSSGCSLECKGGLASSSSFSSLFFCSSSYLFFLSGRW